MPKGHESSDRFRRASLCSTRGGIVVQVLHEHDLVPLLIVEQLVDARAYRQQAEAAGTNALRLADLHMRDWIVGRLTDRGVRQILDLESRSGIGDPVHYQSLRAQAGDADRSRRI